MSDTSESGADPARSQVRPISPPLSCCFAFPAPFAALNPWSFSSHPCHSPPTSLPGCIPSPQWRGGQEEGREGGRALVLSLLFNWEACLGWWSEHTTGKSLYRSEKCSLLILGPFALLRVGRRSLNFLVFPYRAKLQKRTAAL